MRSRSPSAACPTVLSGRIHFLHDHIMIRCSHCPLEVWHQCRGEEIEPILCQLVDPAREDDRPADSSHLRGEPKPPRAVRRHFPRPARLAAAVAIPTETSRELRLMPRPGNRPGKNAPRDPRHRGQPAALAQGDRAALAAPVSRHRPVQPRAARLRPDEYRGLRTTFADTAVGRRQRRLSHLGAKKKAPSRRREGALCCAVGTARLILGAPALSLRDDPIALHECCSYRVFARRRQ